jgi:putative DNA primase/helicase
MPTPHQFSETALAFELVRRHGDNFRYVVDTGQYLYWNGSIWESDLQAIKIARFVTPICCETADQAPPKIIRTLESHRTQQAIIKMAGTDPRVAVKQEQLDGDPLLLGTPSGTIDLRTGRLQPADRKDLITMSTAVAPTEDPNAQHPLWDEFLRSIFPLVPGGMEPDEAMLDFIQRWCGYSATALTRWHHYAFFVGRGRNGKGVLFKTLRSILGAYAGVLPSESLMERPVDPHRAELADLHGRRLVMTNEISPGKWWNESRLNAFASCDPITANFMRQNPFTFIPSFKLWIAANNKPRFRTVDSHTSERLMLVPMRMRFLEDTKGHEDEEDVKPQRQDLAEALEAEYPAILGSYIINGAHLALNSGLNIPDSVRIDSRDYLDAEDELGVFIRSDCVLLKRPKDQAKPPNGDLVRHFAEAWNLRRREDGEKEYTRPDMKSESS